MNAYHTMFLSFLKHERERFPLFVSMRLSIPFLDVRDRSPILTVCMIFLWTLKPRKRFRTLGGLDQTVQINSLKRSRIKYTVGI